MSKKRDLSTHQAIMWLQGTKGGKVTTYQQDLSDLHVSGCNLMGEELAERCGQSRELS